jgi:hypothetical protein
MDPRTDTFGACWCVCPEVCGKDKRCLRRDEAFERLLAPIARLQNRAEIAEERPCHGSRTRERRRANCGRGDALRRLVGDHAHRADRDRGDRSSPRKALALVGD